MDSPALALGHQSVQVPSCPVQTELPCGMWGPDQGSNPCPLYCKEPMSPALQIFFPYFK